MLMFDKQTNRHRGKSFDSLKLSEEDLFAPLKRAERKRLERLELRLDDDDDDDDEGERLI